MDSKPNQNAPKTYSDRALKTGTMAVPMNFKRIQYDELDLTSLDASHNRTNRIHTEDASGDQELYVLTNKITNEVSKTKPEDKSDHEQDIRDFFKEKFIGEFESNYNFKILRAYINQESLDRIFYTKMQPIDTKPLANILLVHGYGHSGTLLEVS